jgi:hypothetical protein
MSIWKEVLDYIQQPDEASFEPLALRVFRHQFESVVPYRNYCVERGVTPDAVRSLEGIPALSTVAFKHAELAGIDRCGRVFVTSGTTNGRSERGRHFVPHPEIYRASALSHLRRMLFPDRAGISMLALHPTADLMPESSLAQMITWCIEEFGNGRTLCAASRKGIEADRALGFLTDSGQAREAVCILGTTAAFAALFSSLCEAGTPIRLASGSRIMDTGGAKGQVRPLSQEELSAAAERWLGIDASMAINEYGMTEMCSQLYDLTAFNFHRADERAGHRRPHADAPGRRRKLGPPWIRADAVDPVTLKRVPDGKVGLLSFFDLANVGSVSALVTEDFGMVEGPEVLVLGRAAGDARGCALALEDFAALEDRRISAA